MKRDKNFSKVVTKKVKDKVKEICDKGISEAKTIVDPPSGWKYGFPKELKPGESYEALLRKSGYPEKDIEFALKWSKWSTE